MMKKYILPLLCLLLLGGCSQQEENTLELTTPAGSVSGSYEGSEVDGLPEGEGVFTSENGWVYEGSFVGGSFASGHVTNYPAPAFNGVYTGAVEALTPQGEGRLLSENSSFTGSFEAGLPHTGEATDFPCSVLFGEESIGGFYTGTLSAALPQGEGSFHTEGSGRTLRYEGSFEEGRAVGEASLYDDGYTVDGRRGCYEGTVLNGLPEGEGSFSGRSADNVDFCYSGQWKNGLYDGEGELLYDSALYYDRIGHFSEGAFDPEPFELLAALGSREPLFTLSEKQMTYISEYPELLDARRKVPHYMEADYRFLWNQNLLYANYAKDPSLGEENWLLFYNYVILQSRKVDVFGEGKDCTVILACNTVYKEPAVFYLFGDASELTNLHYLTAYGIPLGMTHYTNANGEQVEAVAALLGSAGGY